MPDVNIAPRTATSSSGTPSTPFTPNGPAGSIQVANGTGFIANAAAGQVLVSAGTGNPPVFSDSPVVGSIMIGGVLVEFVLTGTPPNRTMAMRVTDPQDGVINDMATFTR